MSSKLSDRLKNKKTVKYEKAPEPIIPYGSFASGENGENLTEIKDMNKTLDKALSEIEKYVPDEFKKFNIHKEKPERKPKLDLEKIELLFDEKTDKLIKAFEVRLLQTNVLLMLEKYETYSVKKLRLEAANRDLKMGNSDKLKLVIALLKHDLEAGLF